MHATNRCQLHSCGSLWVAQADMLLIRPILLASSGGQVLIVVSCLGLQLWCHAGSLLSCADAGSDTCSQRQRPDKFLYVSGLGGGAARVPMAMRAPIGDPPASSEHDVTKTQVLDRSEHASTQHDMQLPAVVTRLSQRDQLTEQQSSNAAASSNHAADSATALADAAAVDNGKKRKAEAEALQLAQAATAVVLNAGKRRASPEAEVGPRNDHSYETSVINA